MIGARTRFGLVIGDPIEHSASPALHNAAFAAAGIDAVFLAARVSAAAVADAVAGFRALRPLGVSVTVPHKQAVAALCDRVEPLAARIGAVNCLQLQGEVIVGHNTDAPGFVDGLRDGLALDPRGARAVLLGAGGAARAVAAGLDSAGADVAVVARSSAKVDWTAAHPWTPPSLATLCAACDLLVDCTSTGLSADAEAALPAPIPLDVLPAHAAVATLVYHRAPALLSAAAARGLRTLDGGLMLAYQGARAFTLWTGRDAPLAAMKAALQRSD